MQSAYGTGGMRGTDTPPEHAIHYDALLSQNGFRNGAILALRVREVDDAYSSSGSSSAGLSPLVASSSDEVPGLT